jgi:hypothetical protein
MPRKPKQSVSERFSEIYGVAFSPTQIETIRQRAKQEDRSFNAIVRRAVNQYLGLETAS